MKQLTVAMTAAAILIFFICLLLSKQPRRVYLLFILYALPVIDFKITPYYYGSLTIFDGLSYVILLLRYKDFLSVYRPNRFYFGAFCTLCFLLIVGSLASHYVFNSVINLFSVFPIFIYGRLLMVECVQDEAFIYKLIGGLKFACILSIVFLGAQMLLGVDVVRLYSQLNPNVKDSNGIRYPSFFHDSQKYAQFLAMLSFLFLINKKDIRRPTFKHLILFLMVVVAIFMTGGRSAFLGLNAGVLILLLFAGARYKKYIIVGCLAGGIVIALLGKSLILFNRQDDINNSLDFRESIWREAYDIYKAHALLGIGIGNYQDFVSRYAQDQYLIMEDDEVVFLDQPENGYLKILTEFGGPGFLVAFAFVLGPVIGSMRAWFKHQTDGQVFLLIAPVVCWLVSFVSLYSISDRRNLIVLVCLLGMLVFSSNRTKLIHDEEPDEPVTGTV